MASEVATIRISPLDAVAEFDAIEHEQNTLNHRRVLLLTACGWTYQPTKVSHILMWHRDGVCMHSHDAYRFTRAELENAK